MIYDNFKEPLLSVGDERALDFIGIQFIIILSLACCLYFASTCPVLLMSVCDFSFMGPRHQLYQFVCLYRTAWLLFALK